MKGPLDQLDHAAMYSCYGGKVGIDGTTKLPDEGLVRPWPPIIEADPSAEARIDELWRELDSTLIESVIGENWHGKRHV